ncbi:TPA: OprD family porin [Pseudomonas putida]|nr:OprD family porin [Pseudomonas putida]
MTVINTQQAAMLLAALFSLYGSVARAEFLNDTKGSLELRNYHLDRDFHGATASQSRRDEWAQGLILQLQSGFTSGPVGLGIDAVGMLGIKLDSSPDRTGTGLLPRRADGSAPDEYSKAVVTFKAKFSQTDVRIGGLNPVLPLLASNNSRLLPQWFDGIQIVSKDLDKFTLTALKITSTKLRDSSDSEELRPAAQQGAYSSTVSSDRLYYAGVDYQPVKNLQLTLHISQLEDIFLRHFAGFKFRTEVGPGEAFTEWRYFTAEETGRRLLREVDNQTLSTNFGYSIKGHTFSGGYQKGRGETAYASVGGTDTYLFSEQQLSTFALENERAWMMRYDYNFAELGVPGLTFNIRYVKGDQVNPESINSVKAKSLLAKGDQGEEWERTTDITYVIQSGTFKDVYLRWRNSTMRSNFTTPADENRVMVGYTFKF